MKEQKLTVQLAGKQEDHPVAMLVQIASRYDSHIHLKNGERRVNAKSIMGMMALGLENGSVLEVTADGPDEDDAAAAVAAYLTGTAQ